jgi:hypothetical protein
MTAQADLFDRDPKPSKAARTSQPKATPDATRYVIRNGGHWLQGENGWGQRSAAREFTRAELVRFLRDFPYPTAMTEPCLHAYIDGVCHRCQEPEPRVSATSRVTGQPTR